MNAGNDFSGKAIKLTDKIDLSAHYWVPIGTDNHKFKGTFDGQNNQIIGMFISENNNSEYVGLFGYINSSALTNIIVSGKIEITLDRYIRLGGICGHADDGSITNCHNFVNMSISSISSGDNYIRIGGITGSIKNSTTISDCSNYGSIFVDSSSISQDKHQLGGIVGEIDSTTGQNTAKIVNCYNEGNISNKISDKGHCEIGGLCGYVSDALIINGYNSGVITSTSTSGKTESYIGGLIGFTDGLYLLNSYNIGDIEVESSTYCNDIVISVGGVIGHSSGWAYLTSTYNLGNIGVNSNAKNDLNTYVGGLIGYFRASYTYFCYNAGNISVKTNLTNTTVPGTEGILQYLEKCSAIGGIVGCNYSGTIQNCYNSGKIEAHTTDHVDENISNPGVKLYLGGLIGYNNAGGNLKNDYNIGIINIFTTTSVESINENSLDIALGGIAGKADYGDITSCYNVAVASSSSSIVKCGGIFGYESNVGTLNNIYYSDGNPASIGNKPDDNRATKLSNDGMKYLKLLSENNNLNNNQESRPWSPDIFGANDGYPVLADVPIQLASNVPKSVVYLVTNNEELQQENYLKLSTLTINSKLNIFYPTSNLQGFDVVTHSYSWKKLNMSYPSGDAWTNITTTDISKNNLLLSDNGTYCGVITYDVSETSSSNPSTQYHYTTLSRTVDLKPGLIYESNDGSDRTYSVLPDENKQVTVEDNMFHYDGHAFVGWASKDGSVKYEVGSIISIDDSGSKTIYAQWKKASTVTIDVSQENATIVITDESGNTIKPEKDGTYMLLPGKYNCKVFKSGYITETKEIVITDSDANENKETTVTINLSSSSSGGIPVSYNIVYNANGGSGTLIDANSPYHSGVTVTVLANNFTKDGFTFKNWNTKADGSGTSYSAGDKFTINSNVTLYAQWEETSIPPVVQKVTVTFYIGDEVYKVIEVNKNSSLGDKLPVNPESSDSNSKFKEWNTKADGSGTAFTSDSIVNEDTSVYAVWEKSSSNSGNNCWWWIIIIIIILIIIMAAYYYYKKNQN